MPQHQNAGRRYSMKIDNSSIERVEEFKHLETTLTNKNSIQEEIMSRLKLGNACYYSVQNLFSSSLLSKNLKIKIYRTIILPVVQYGCETWSLTLREGRRLRVFENRVLRRVFGPNTHRSPLYHCTAVNPRSTQLYTKYYLNSTVNYVPLHSSHSAVQPTVAL